MRVTLIVLLVLAGVTITAAIVAGPRLRATLERFTPRPPATQVRVEPAAVRSLTETVSAPGEIEPYTQVNIAAVVSARIEELAVDEGDVVRTGDLLAKLDDRDLRTTLRGATARKDSEAFRLRSEQARLDGVRNALEFARKEMDRMAALYETGDVAMRDLDEAIERVRDLESSENATSHSISVIESSIAAADAEIERANEGLANTVIRSPIDGIVTRRPVEVGEIVTGSTTNPGTIMMTVADLSRMLLRARVAESDIAQIEIGQAATIYVNAYPDDTFAGTVRQIALQREGAADGTGFFPTEIEIDLRGERLYSGLVANVDVVTAVKEGIVVPSQAIVSREVEALPESIRANPLVDAAKRHTSVVYCIVDGKARCTPVRAGASDLTHRIVLQGLDEGDVVVVGPYKVLDGLEHDQALAIMKQIDEKSGADAAGADRDGAGADEDGTAP